MPPGQPDAKVTPGIAKASETAEVEQAALIEGAGGIDNIIARRQLILETVKIVDAGVEVEDARSNIVTPIDAKVQTAGFQRAKVFKGSVHLFAVTRDRVAPDHLAP